MAGRGAIAVMPRSLHTRQGARSPLPNSRSMRNATVLLSCMLLSCLLLLPGCSGNTDPTATRTDADAALPQPDAGSGPVTGMPNRPGPGPVGDAVNTGGAPQDSPFSASSIELAQDTETSDTRLGATPGSGTPVSNTPVPNLPESAMDATNAEPTVQDALTTLGDYYAAINARHYDRAYSLWSDNGKASGQSAQQFVNGYANTRSVDVRLGEPGRVDAAAGSRYIQIPVSIIATRDNGDIRRYIGDFTLRRAVVDGASPEQRQWRLASADIRVVEP